MTYLFFFFLFTAGAAPQHLRNPPAANNGARPNLRAPADRRVRFEEPHINGGHRYMGGPQLPMLPGQGFYRAPQIPMQYPAAFLAPHAGQLYYPTPVVGFALGPPHVPPPYVRREAPNYVHPEELRRNNLNLPPLQPANLPNAHPYVVLDNEPAPNRARPGRGRARAPNGVPPNPGAYNFA